MVQTSDGQWNSGSGQGQVADSCESDNDIWFPQNVRIL